jgi:hypothetical protein
MNVSRASRKDDSDFDTERRCSRVSFAKSDESSGSLFTGHSVGIIMPRVHDRNVLDLTLDSHHERNKYEDDRSGDEILEKKKISPCFVSDLSLGLHLSLLPF